MENCSISVIIPTTGKRQELLRRSICSALSVDESILAEVIVIANGPEAGDFLLPEGIPSPGKASVQVVRTDEADANHARNIGIETATGQLLRFLDDDDYLLPNAAAAQYIYMIENELDFCSGGAILVDQDNKPLGQLPQPDTPTPEVAVLARNRVQMVFSHVYRRNSIGGVRWPVGMKQSEDIVWLIRYAAAAPRRWMRFGANVGAWYQHTGHRQSLNRPSGSVHEATAEVLLEACTTLQAQGRWTDELASTTADALWEVSHRAFPFRPIYWTRVATKAMCMNSTSRSSAPMYGYPLLRHIDPRLLMWLLLPKRLTSLAHVFLRGAVVGHDYRRTL